MLLGVLLGRPASLLFDEPNQPQTMPTFSPTAPAPLLVLVLLLVLTAASRLCSPCCASPRHDQMRSQSDSRRSARGLGWQGSRAIRWVRPTAPSPGARAPRPTARRDCTVQDPHIYPCTLPSTCSSRPGDSSALAPCAQVNLRIRMHAEDEFRWPRPVGHRERDEVWRGSCGPPGRLRLYTPRTPSRDREVRPVRRVRARMRRRACTRTRPRSTCPTTRSRRSHFAALCGARCARPRAPGYGVGGAAARRGPAPIFVHACMPAGKTPTAATEGRRAGTYELACPTSTPSAWTVGIRDGTRATNRVRL